MMAQVRCSGCIYWHPPTKTAYATAASRGVGVFGQCRFNPPTLTKTDAGFRGLWPTVDEDQWCGQHAVLEVASE